MLAGGLRIGVAREAGLYMIKAGRAILDENGDVVEEDIPADAVLASLLHIVDKLNDGTLIKGKTVVIIDTGKCPLPAAESLRSGSPKPSTADPTKSVQCGTIGEAWSRGLKRSPKSLIRWISLVSSSPSLQGTMAG